MRVHVLGREGHGSCRRCTHFCRDGRRTTGNKCSFELEIGKGKREGGRGREGERGREREGEDRSPPPEHICSNVNMDGRTRRRHKSPRNFPNAAHSVFEPASSSVGRHQHASEKSATPLCVSCCLRYGFVLTYSTSTDRLYETHCCLAISHSGDS